MSATAIAREAMATGSDPAAIADALVAQLRDPGLRLVVLFVDARLEQHAIARAVSRALPDAPVIGCTARGMISRRSVAEPPPAAVALGLAGDWLRVGVGLARGLSRSPLVRSRDAMLAAAAAIGVPAGELDPERHLALSIVDGRCGHEEAFCIGGAAAAPQIRVVGGSASSELLEPRPTPIFANGSAHVDAGVIAVLESDRPIRPVTSSHLQPTASRAIVTACDGRRLDELDGIPAARRLRQLVDQQAGDREPLSFPAKYAFARYVDGVPYVRSIMDVSGDSLTLAGTVEPGHVLRLMKPGDLVAQTRADLAAAAVAVGGAPSALIAFSCVTRHYEAAANGTTYALAEAYAAYPVVGLETFGEQIGMVMVNHTLTGVVIG